MQVADFIKQIDIIGHKMFIDVIDTLYFKDNQSFEPYETSIMESMIQEGDIFVDIGANLGYYTLLAARKVGKKGKVYAFEPDTKNFQLLKVNIESNGYENVTLERKAISNENKKVALYKSNISNMDHSLFESAVFFLDNVHETVETVSLDSYMNGDLRNINFIKMDIQAGEWDALQGMNKILDNSPLTIFMEFWIKGLQGIGVDPKNVIDLLLNKGFKLTNILEEKRILDPLDSQEKIDNLINDPYSQKNLICIKG